MANAGFTEAKKTLLRKATTVEASFFHYVVLLQQQRVFSTKLIHFPFGQVTALCVVRLFYSASDAFSKELIRTS